MLNTLDILLTNTMIDQATAIAAKDAEITIFQSQVTSLQTELTEAKQLIESEVTRSKTLVVFVLYDIV
jgi:hypothetical protein